MSSWQEQISDPAGLGVDHGEGENAVMADPVASGLHWHWGQNIPGYMPMSDDFNMSTTWNGARDAVADDIDRAGDMADADDYAPGWAESWREAIDAVRGLAIPGKDFYVNVCSDGAHDLGVSYWVTACHEDECWDAWEREQSGWGDWGRASLVSASILLGIAGTGAAMIVPMVQHAVNMLGGAG